jgi:hypothetical protein
MESISRADYNTALFHSIPLYIEALLHGRQTLSRYPSLTQRKMKNLPLCQKIWVPEKGSYLIEEILS